MANRDGPSAPPTTPPNLNNNNNNYNNNNKNNNALKPDQAFKSNAPHVAGAAAAPALPEVTAESSSLASLPTHTDTLSSAKTPRWVPPKNQKTLNVDDIMNLEKTQSIEAKVPNANAIKLQQSQPETNDIKDVAMKGINNTPAGVQLVSDAMTRVYSENVLNQEDFDKKHGFRRVNLSLLRILEGHYHQVLKWKLPQWGGFFKSRVPILEWIPSYDWRNDILADITGGLMVSIMSIPQGLAYGFLVGLPPIFGLYSCIFGPLVYAVLGTSKHASPGAFAILALMVGSIVEQLKTDPNDLVPSDLDNVTETLCCSENHSSSSANSDGPDPEILAIVTCVTFVTGVIQILLGFLNAGLLAVWLSDHLVQGLTSGAAIHVLTSQLKTMTGIPNLPKTSDPHGIIKFYVCFFDNIHNIQAPETICSLICIFCLVFSKEFLDKVFSKWIKWKVPMELFVVVFSTLLNWSSADTTYDFDLREVGYVTSGFHRPTLPGFQYADKVIGTALSIAIISFVIHIALAKLISKKESYPLDPNQEWLALGTMNTIGAFFGCFAGGSSLSRTMTQFKLKTKSQLSTVVCVLLLICVVFFLSTYFYYLPLPVLSCIVVVALKDLMVQIFQSFSLFGQSFLDFLIWFVTFAAVVLVNVNIGLVIGVAFALLTVIFRSQWPESSLLGRIPGTCDFKGKLHYKDAEEIPGIFVFRFDAPLYFANAELFLNRIRDIVNIQPMVIAVDLKKKTNREKAIQKKVSKRELKENSTRQDPPTAATPQEQPLLSEVGGGKSEIALVYRGSERQKSKSRKEMESQVANANPEEPHDTATTEGDVRITHIVIDCSSFPYIDLMGLDALGQVHSEFKALSIQVYFACCKVGVRQLFEQTKFYEKIPKTHLFVSVWDAVNKAQKDRADLAKKEENQNEENEGIHVNVELPLSTNSVVLTNTTKERTKDHTENNTIPDTHGLQGGAGKKGTAAAMATSKAASKPNEISPPKSKDTNIKNNDGAGGKKQPPAKKPVEPSTSKPGEGKMKTAVEK